MTSAASASLRHVCRIGRRVDVAPTDQAMSCGVAPRDAGGPCGAAIQRLPERRERDRREADAGQRREETQPRRSAEARQRSAFAADSRVARATRTSPTNRRRRSGHPEESGKRAGNSAETFCAISASVTPFPMDSRTSRVRARHRSTTACKSTLASGVARGRAARQETSIGRSAPSRPTGRCDRVRTSSSSRCNRRQRAWPRARR